MCHATAQSISVSFWSLLSAAIEMSQGHPLGQWFPAVTGFFWGQLSAIVEPLAAVAGAAVVVIAKPILPYALAFAAGAMIFVVVEEVIPESQHNGNTELATAGTILGFMVMMALDVAFS
jgi:ZIP family zinc transporter